MKPSFLILLAGIPFAIAAQSVNSTSAENTQSGISISHIIGQTVVAESENGMLSTGSASSYLISAITGNDLLDVSLVEVDIYPNPTKDILVLKTGKLDEPSYKITGMDGKSFGTGAATEKESKINLSTLPSGTYLLSVYNKESVKKTFKIIKK